MNTYRHGQAHAPHDYQSRPAPVRVPEEAGEGRLTWAVVTDVLLASGIGVAVVAGLLQYSLSDLAFAPAVLGIAVAASFVNHVFGTVLFRGSFGKQLFGLRVVRATTGQRSGFWRAVGRWLLGFVLLAVAMVAEDGVGIGEANGLRVIRRRDERQ
ncbi:RDD family protein [Nocardia carnea]|uniref:RDD family protein n=1 Tax=Nocardia carnea TaxID=37328 RepID=UPI0024568A9D|nr:RDD family protein [Nocardia carnea]